MEEKLPSNGGFKVLFIDYGNRATVPTNKIRTLDGAYTAIPPQVGGGEDHGWEGLVGSLVGGLMDWLSDWLGRGVARGICVEDTLGMD